MNKYLYTKYCTKTLYEINQIHKLRFVLFYWLGQAKFFCNHFTLTLDI